MSATGDERGVARVRAVATRTSRAARRHAGGPHAGRHPRGVRPGRRGTRRRRASPTRAGRAPARPAARALDLRASFVTDPAIQAQLVDCDRRGVPAARAVRADGARAGLRRRRPRRPHRARRPAVGRRAGSTPRSTTRSRGCSPRTRPRNEVVRTLRGLLLATLLVALPIASLFVGAAAQWVLERRPDPGTSGASRGSWSSSRRRSARSCCSSLAAVARLPVRARGPVPARALRRPAILVGMLLAGFTQLFAFLAPLMLRIAALFGAIVDGVRAARVAGDRLQHAADRGRVDARAGGRPWRGTGAGRGERGRTDGGRTPVRRRERPPSRTGRRTAPSPGACRSGGRTARSPTATGRTARTAGRRPRRRRCRRRVPLRTCCADAAQRAEESGCGSSVRPARVVGRVRVAGAVRARPACRATAARAACGLLAGRP